MRENLCADSWDYFNSQEECEKFISGTLTQGMHTTLIRYFETLLSNLANYQLYLENDEEEKIQDIFNSEEFYEVYVI